MHIFLPWGVVSAESWLSRNQSDETADKSRLWRTESLCKGAGAGERGGSQNAQEFGKSESQVDAREEWEGWWKADPRAQCKMLRNLSFIPSH